MFFPQPKPPESESQWGLGWGWRAGICFLDGSKNTVMSIFVTVSPAIFWHLSHFVLCLWLGLVVTLFNLYKSFSSFSGLPPSLLPCSERMGASASLAPSILSACPCLSQGWCLLRHSKPLEGRLLSSCLCPGSSHIVGPQLIHWMNELLVYGHRKGKYWGFPDPLAGTEKRNESLLRGLFLDRKIWPP